VRRESDSGGALLLPTRDDPSPRQKFVEPIVGPRPKRRSDPQRDDHVGANTERQAICRTRKSPEHRMASGASAFGAPRRDFVEDLPIGIEKTNFEKASVSLLLRLSGALEAQERGERPDHIEATLKAAEESQRLSDRQAPVLHSRW
jgi:hypothetical protein